MAEFLEYTLDKFIFKMATDRLYSPAGLWLRAGDGRITIGVSDFLQQRNGDVAFADVVEAGTAVATGDELATLETIKVDIELPAPVSGVVVEVNETLEMEAEVINQDPYGAGWLAVIEARVQKALRKADSATFSIRPAYENAVSVGLKDSLSTSIR